jgi:hypothetical protein
MKNIITTLAILFAFFAVKAQDCDPVRNLTAEFIDGYSECAVKLTWDEPEGVILWDNTDIDVAAGGIISSYWSGNDNWIFVADDFDADAPWSIKKIHTQGYSDVPSIYPDKFAIAIYSDQAGKPGTEIYRNTDISVENGATPVIILPEPFELPSAGKYWIAIAGAYNASVNAPEEIADYRWNINYGTTPIGANFHLQDKSGLMVPQNSWIDASELIVNSYLSIYFMIEGEPNSKGTEYLYRVYRDGCLLASDWTSTIYIDEHMDPYEPHTWSVTVICSYSGYESIPVSVSREPCLSGIGAKESQQNINIHPNPTTGELTVETDNYPSVQSVGIFDVMDKLVFFVETHGRASLRQPTSTINISHLPAGIYFVRIQTENGTMVTKKVVKQ